MPYRIPTDERLSDAISSVMKRNQHVKSQSYLAKLVRNELHKEDDGFRVSEDRIRRLGIEQGIFKMSIDYRESDIVDIPSVCPVCRNAMDPVMNMSLAGDMVEIKRKCSVCPYCISGKISTPRRYTFMWTSHTISEEEQKLRKLRKARMRIEQASELITEALRMSELEERGHGITDALGELITSKDMSYSIRNIIADLKSKEEEEHPIWTRPAVSPKNKDLKDI